MNLGLFLNRVFSASSSACILSYWAQQTIIFILPFFLVNILSLASDRAGFTMLLFPLSMMVCASFGGSAADRLGSKIPAVAGFLLFAAAALILSRLSAASPLSFVFIALALAGAGSGFAVPSVNTSIFSAVKKDEAGIASGMVGTARTFGQTFGVAVAGAILAWRQAVYASAPSNTSAPGEAADLHSQGDVFLFVIGVSIAGALLAMTLPGKGKLKH
jgi:DHA2 family methylenomycin A resistance protein-like MFS transporter